MLILLLWMDTWPGPFLLACCDAAVRLCARSCVDTCQTLNQSWGRGEVYVELFGELPGSSCPTSREGRRLQRCHPRGQRSVTVALMCTLLTDRAGPPGLCGRFTNTGRPRCSCGSAGPLDHCSDPECPVHRGHKAGAWAAATKRPASPHPGPTRHGKAGEGRSSFQIRRPDNLAPERVEV